MTIVYASLRFHMCPISGNYISRLHCYLGTDISTGASSRSTIIGRSAFDPIGQGRKRPHFSAFFLTQPCSCVWLQTNNWRRCKACGVSRPQNINSIPRKTLLLTEVIIICCSRGSSPAMKAVSTLSAFAAGIFVSTAEVRPLYILSTPYLGDKNFMFF
jgi:hypothetical protein